MRWNIPFVHVFSVTQEHVMIFSFILCVGIKAGEGAVNTEVWAFLLTGGSPMAKETVFPNPAPQWMRQVSLSLSLSFCCKQKHFVFVIHEKY